MAIKLRQKIVLLPVAAVIVLGCVAAVLLNGAVYSALRTRLLEQNTAATTYLAGAAVEPLLGLDSLRLATLIAEFKKSRPGEVDYVFMLDDDGAILSHTFGTGVPLALAGANRPEDSPDPGAGPPALSVKELTVAGRTIYDFAYPVRLGATRVGSVRVGFNLDRLYAELTRVALLSAVLLIVVVLGIILVAVHLAGGITRPLIAVRDAARQIAGGNLGTTLEIRTGDELQELANSFNAMSAKLKESYSILEAKVAERTGALETEIAARQRDEEQLRATLEQLGQSNKELEQFAYIASHDLKEPLRGIETFGKFLAEDYADKLDAEGRDYLKRIIAGTVRMRNLIDDLLALSRLTRIKNPYATVDSGKLLDEVIKRLKPVLEEKQVQLEIDDELPHIHCDAVKMREVFYNLISNAMKYNDKPEIRIAVGCKDGAFFVRDNGIGIPAEHFADVFQVFKRLHARDEFGGGTGAGLAIVNNIISEHKGRIWIESAEGRGTTFFFTVPPEVEKP